MAESRRTAEQRRAQAVDAGLLAFADRGLTTSAIQQVAGEIGVSQPYVFRLFGSKQAFFLACIDELEARMVTTFAEAAKGGSGAADAPFEHMGAGFRDLVADGVVSGLWLQASTLARTDEAVAVRCRSLLSKVLHTIEKHTSATPDELAAFFGRGALVVLLQALGVDLTDGSGAAVKNLFEAGESR